MFADNAVKIEITLLGKAQQMGGSIMKKHNGKWLQLIVLSITALLVIGGCGGGGGGGGGSTPPAKSTISGAVTFPSIGSLVAKRVGSLVDSTDVSVGVYDLAGTEIQTVVPKYDNALAADARIFSYTFTGLDTGKDYVIKAKRSNVVLKKLIEKKDVIENTVGQNINSVSTVAVIVASNQLGAVLGDVLPAGKTVSGLSTLINTDIKPVLLEGTIDAVVNANGTTGVTTQNLAAYANVFNIVVTAAVENVDPAAMFTATPPTLVATVPILTVAAGSTVATVTQTTITATVVTDSADPTYTAPTTETAAMYTAAAKDYLTKQDISNAALNYEKALSIDANDPEANFGGAITSGMMMMEDPDVQAIITKWGAVVPTVNQVVQGTSPIKLPFGNMTSIKFTPKTTAKSVGSVATATTTQNVLAAFSVLKAKLPQQKSGYKSLAKTLNSVPDTAPSISEMQTLIDNVIIPRIDKINARLAKAETATFSFTITKAMQGNPVNGTDETLNAGELYTLDAALNVFQVLFKIAGSYHFDIPTTYTYDTIGQDPLALINNPTTLTLNTGGAARMLGALDNARAAAAKAKLAYDTVVTRAAGVGMFDLASWTLTDKTDFTNGLTKVTGALAGSYDLVYNNNGTKTININVPRFFTDPLTRAQLPTFGYDVPRDATLSAKYDKPVAGERTYSYQSGSTWDTATSTYIPVYQTRTEAIRSEFEPTSDLPDYTLNGILPTNTIANNVAEFNGILPMVAGAGKLLTGSVDFYNYDSRSCTTDVNFIYYLTSNMTGGTSIKKIDIATGAVSLHASGTGLNGRLIWNNNAFYAISTMNGMGSYTVTISPVTVNGTTFTVGTPTWTSSSYPSSYANLTAVASDGTDIYYAVTTWDSLTYKNSTVVHRLSNLTTDNPLVTIPDYVDSLAFRSGFLYTDGDKRNPAASYSVVASYANGNSDVMVGGYNYKAYDGKLVKYAGTPAGGAAKVALAKYFGF